VVGYIPIERAYKEGGYEVESCFKYLGYPATFPPETCKIVEKEALALIKSL
ncbi:unnamed protein product, partial [marine sediment metagenome]